MLQAALLALMAALGIAAGGALSDQQRRRQRSTADAGIAPVAGTATDAQTTTAGCKRCPPDCGTLVRVNHNMNEPSAEYQARMSGFAPGTEWAYMGIEFDGFRSAACLLIEAKGNYDQFLVEEGGLIELKYPWAAGMWTRMIKQAAAQSSVVLSSRPAGLHWYFQTPLTYELMAPKLLLMPPIQPIFVP